MDPPPDVIMRLTEERRILKQDVKFNWMTCSGTQQWFQTRLEGVKMSDSMHHILRFRTVTFPVSAPFTHALSS
jgi:hypothetical protein